MTSDPSAQIEECPVQVGPYRILNSLGRGGMGSVYLADQTEPIRRKVALKVLHSRLIDQDGLRRFHAERQALARLIHPNIAQVYDAGTTPGGMPYLAMEFVPGKTIISYCDEHRLGLGERLELFQSVCDGVQHAHRKGLLHRDIKPSNILVSEDTGRPIPKIIDFGVAKALDRPLTDDVPHTAAHIVVGTPGYLSPEAINGEDVDTRSDVYSLSVVLYQLLAGVPPFAADATAIERLVATTVIVAPSERLTRLGAKAEQVAAARGFEPQRLVHRLRGDLDSIVLKGLAEEPARRYESPADLSADLDRFRRHEPVGAESNTLSYRARKLIRRHRVGFSAVVLVLAALVAGLTTTAIAARQARLEAARATREAEAARQVADFLVDLFEIADPAQARGEDIAIKDVLARGATKIERELGDQPLIRARMMEAIGEVHVKLGNATDAEPLLEGALALRRSTLGDSHVEVATSLNSLAVVYQVQARYSEAAELLRRSLEISRSTLGAEHPEVASVLMRLGVNHWYTNELAEAERLLEQALAIQQETLGPEHSEVARTLNNLALVLEDRGDLEGARAHLERALSIQEQTLGPDHPDIASCLNNLAKVLKSQGSYTVAEEYYRRALEIRERVLGADHPEVATSLSNLANVLITQGELERAVELTRRALAIAEHAFGPVHPDVATYLSNLASLHMRLGEDQAARPIAERALAVWEETLGPNHIFAATALLNLGTVTGNLGDHVEAERLFRRSLAVTEASVGPEHPDLAYPLLAIGSALVTRDQPEQAEPLLRKAVRLRRDGLGPDHPLVEEAVTYLDEALLAMGREPEGGALGE